MMSPKGIVQEACVRIAVITAVASAGVLMSGCSEVTPSPATGNAMLTTTAQHGDMPEVVVRASRQ